MNPDQNQQQQHQQPHQRPQNPQNQPNTQPRTLLKFILRGLENGVTNAILQPLNTAVMFNQTKSVNPYIQKHKTQIPLNSFFDLLRHLKARDGSYKLWNCFLSSTFTFAALSYRLSAKKFIMKKIFKIETSGPIQRENRPPRRVSVPEALKFYVGCLFSDTITYILYYPLEVGLVKILTDYAPIPKYEHLLDCLTKILSRDGLRGLFQGFKIKFAQIAIFSASTTFLFFLGQSNSIFPQNRKNKGILYHFVGLVESIFTSPLVCLWRRILVAPGGEAALWAGLGLFGGLWVHFLNFGVQVTNMYVMRWEERLRVEMEDLRRQEGGVGGQG